MFSFSRSGTPFSDVPPSDTPRKGYFAFPAGYCLTPEKKLEFLDQLAQSEKHATETKQASVKTTVTEAVELARLALEQEWLERSKFEEERRRVRAESEREEALIGEKHWVRQGGVLRDANGRRDSKRTEEVRLLVVQEDAERCVLERWSRYESAWAKMASSSDPVTFAGVPWPLIVPPKDTSDLRNPSGIADFLFESLSLKGITTTRKDRLRMSLLRWHPDKLGGVLARVRKDDLDAVKGGIDAVVISLRSLQEAEKVR